MGTKKQLAELQRKYDALANLQLTIRTETQLKLPDGVSANRTDYLLASNLQTLALHAKLSGGVSELLRTTDGLVVELGTTDPWARVVLR